MDEYRKVPKGCRLCIFLLATELIDDLLNLRFAHSSCSGIVEMRESTDSALVRGKSTHTLSEDSATGFAMPEIRLAVDVME